MAKVRITLFPAATPAAGTATDMDVPVALLCAVPMFLTKAIAAGAALRESRMLPTDTAMSKSVKRHLRFLFMAVLFDRSICAHETRVQFRHDLTPGSSFRVPCVQRPVQLLHTLDEH
jgi:hypothetical protein